MTVGMETEIEERGWTMAMIAAGALRHAVEAKVQSGNVNVIEREFVNGIHSKENEIGSATIAISTADKLLLFKMATK